MRLLNELCSESERCRNGNMTGGVGACECECVALMLFRAECSSERGTGSANPFKGGHVGMLSGAKLGERDGRLETSDRPVLGERAGGPKLACKNERGGILY